AITIASPRTPTPTDRPDLSAAGVQVSADTLSWGDSLQVSANLHNGGRADAGAVRVRFLLTLPNVATDSAIVLADTTVPSLRADATQGIAQTLRLPSRLPEGLMPTGPVAGRIVVQVDPENTIDEANETN